MDNYNIIWEHQNLQKPNLTIVDKSTGKTLKGEDISAIWYRKPDFPKNFPYDINPEVNRHNEVEAKQFFIFLMHYLSNIYSIGNHFYDKRANSKMLQSQLASKLGMRIADTCYTNDKEDALKFAEKYNFLAIKCLRDHWLKSEDGKVYDLSTQKVPSHLLVDQPKEAFEQCVIFMQEYIEKKYELRITVMGPYIFTCKLDSQLQTETTGAIDWRQGYDYGLKHEIIETPPQLSNFCKNYLRSLNLNFGCFDFIVTKDDDFVFLECNPNGQWGWIEDECNIPMSEAMVDCLQNCLTV